MTSQAMLSTAIACTALLDLVPPDPIMPRQECDSSNEYSEEPNTNYHLADLLEQF